MCQLMSVAGTSSSPFSARGVVVFSETWRRSPTHPAKRLHTFAGLYDELELPNPPGGEVPGLYRVLADRCRANRRSVSGRGSQHQ